MSWNENDMIDDMVSDMKLYCPEDIGVDCLTCGDSKKVAIVSPIDPSDINIEPCLDCIRRENIRGLWTMETI